MTDNPSPENESDAQMDVDMATSERTTVSQTYKVLGELADPTAVGVLGRNTASSGTPIGVKGVVPDTSDGYGLSTPNDAHVGGVAELTAVGGVLTGDRRVGDLLGKCLVVNSGRLTAKDARIDVGDGDTVINGVDGVTFEGRFTLTDDEGTVTIEKG